MLLSDLSLVQFVRPYKSARMNTLAIASQFSLVCVFLGGAFIKLFSAEASENDTDSVLKIVCIMVAFNVFVLVIFLTLAGYQLSTSFMLPAVRLVATSQVPELRLSSGLQYHLFLSHIWSSGQDQMATVKRELQLLLYGVCVFLDVDDLEDIGQLDKCALGPSNLEPPIASRLINSSPTSRALADVNQTQTMLFFLSKGCMPYSVQTAGLSKLYILNLC